MTPSMHLPERWADQRLSRPERYRITPSTMQKGMIIGDAQSGQVFYLITSNAVALGDEEEHFQVDIEYPEDGQTGCRRWLEQDAVGINVWVVAHHRDTDLDVQAIVGDQHE